jgi:hypothetical protein
LAVHPSKQLKGVRSVTTADAFKWLMAGAILTAFGGAASAQTETVTVSARLRRKVTGI